MSNWHRKNGHLASLGATTSAKEKSENFFFTEFYDLTLLKSHLKKKKKKKKSEGE